MSQQNENCPCPEYTKIPIKALNLDGISVSLDPASLPSGIGVEPGPDNTHLVSRDGELAWDPIASGGDGISYSDEEQWTGQFWIDGKKVYQKTIALPALRNNASTTFPHNIPELEFVVDASIVCKTDQNQFIFVPSASAESYQVGAHVYQQSVLVKTYRSGVYQLYSCFATIKYTCTDR